MQNRYIGLKVEELCASLKNNTINIEQYIADTLAVIEAKDANICAMLPEPDRRERLFSEARKLQALYPEPGMRPPLYGLLIGVKDLFNVDGLPTQAGSKLPPEAFAGCEAEVVSKLKAMGAIVLGKTVSTEFAYFNPGATQNPLNLSHTPGGSSSGSAAAVAAGYCHVALGTQTIASIIRPASYCGVYGFKPSWGKVSTKGVFPFSQSADHVGIICKYYEDMEFVARYLLEQQTTGSTDSMKCFGIAAGRYIEQADESVLANFNNTVTVLRSKGIKVIELDVFGDIDKINDSHRKLIAAEFTYNHKNLYSQFSHLYSKASKELIELGIGVSGEEIKQCHKEQLMLREHISSVMLYEGIDAWISPSTTSTAPLGLSSTGSPLMSLPWTNAGLPSISIPNGMDNKGLAFGLQLVCRFGSDLTLLSDKVYNRITYSATADAK
jgi:Asp-tRNA(Asn)/Glu-tRNA(Gln) amidotransferase A subunit family amidase